MAADELIDLVEVCRLAGISKVIYFDAVRLLAWPVPSPLRKPGKSAKHYFRRSEVAAFLLKHPFNEAMLEKLKESRRGLKMNAGIDLSLATSFITGGFDRPALVEKYLKRCMSAKLSRPKTRLIHLTVDI